MELEIKKFHPDVKADETGALEAVFSTFGVIDDDGDIVEASAFTNGQPVMMVWAHDWADPVGKGVVEVTASEAIFRGQFFMDTERGKEAYKTVKATGDLQEYSWGFRVTDAAWEQRDERYIRVIKRAELYEVSPVLKGAGVGTRTLALKGKQSLSDQMQTVLDAVGAVGERVRSVAGLREADGRKLSKERREEIRELAGKLRQAADDVERAAADPADARKLYNQYLAIEARLTGALTEQ